MHLILVLFSISLEISERPIQKKQSLAALKEVFADPLLSGELPGDTELLEISDGAPNAAIGIVKLYRAYREQQGRLSDLSQLMGQAGHTVEAKGKQMPVEIVRSLFETTPWCFPSLERVAERIRTALGDTRGTMAALYKCVLEHQQKIWLASNWTNV